MAACRARAQWRFLELPHGDRQCEDAEDEAPNKRRKQESDPEPHVPVIYYLCDDLSHQGAKSVGESAKLDVSERFEGEREGELSTKLDDVVLEMRDMKSELLQVRELVGVLVRRERCAEMKAEIATRRLNRMEKERDAEGETECEATLEEALTNQSKVVQVIVDKWFVDKGFGFGTTRQKRSPSCTPAPCRELKCLRSALTRGCKW